MRFITLASISTLLGFASRVIAIGQLGFDLGVKRNDGTCKTAEDYVNDLNVLKEYTTVIKTYAVSDCNTLEILGPVAESMGFTIFLGVWPTDEAHFERERAALVEYLPKIKESTVAGFLVGSESLYRKSLTATELASKIDNVRELIGTIKDSEGNSYSNKKVGTVDSWNVLVDGYNKPAIEACDMIMANAFSYWQGQAMNNASYSFFDDIMQVLQVVQTDKGDDFEFWVGETGWPTAGSDFENGIPSVSNAAEYWQQAICAMRGWGVNVIVFEAFDEDWKPNTSDTSGTERHWGVWTSNLDLKYPLKCEFD